MSDRLATMVDKPPSKRAVRAAETRDRILDAAQALFEEQGYLASPVAEIVVRAGVAHGTFYRYFESREQIRRELAEKADARLNAVREVVVREEAGTTPAQRLRMAIRAFLETYRDQARLMGVVEEGVRHDSLLRGARNERLRHYNEELAGSIRSLQRRGLADPSLDPSMTAAILGSITLRFPELWLTDRVVTCDFDAAADQIAKIFITTLGLDDTAST